MHKLTVPVENEEGSIIVIALIMLMLVTVMGLSSTTTTTIETRIAGNDRTYKENFYMADSAVFENAQRIENGGDALKNPNDASAPAWFIQDSDLNDTDGNGNITVADMVHIRNWENVTTAPATTASWATASINNNTLFFTVFGGVTAGSSLDVSRSRLYSYKINTRTKRNNGQIFLEGGFRRAF